MCSPAAALFRGRYCRCFPAGRPRGSRRHSDCRGCHDRGDGHNVDGDGGDGFDGGGDDGGGRGRMDHSGRWRRCRGGGGISASRDPKNTGAHAEKADQHEGSWNRSRGTLS